MSASRQVFVNTLTAWAGTAVNGVVGFLLVPFLLLRLGKSGYGLTVLIGSIVALTPLVDLGLRAALGRHLAEHVAKRDSESFNQLISSALFVYLLVGVICALVCLSFSAAIAHWFRIDSNSLAVGRNLIRLYAGAMILLGFISPVFSGTLIALGRFDVLNAIGLVAALARAGGFLIALGVMHGGLYGWALVNVASTTLSVLLAAFMASRLWPQMRFALRFIRLEKLRSLFSLGGYMFTLQITRMASMQSDPIVISRFLGPAAVALYNPGLSLVSTFRPLIAALSDQASPFATHYHVQGQQERLQDLLIRGTRYTFLMGILAFSFVGVFAAQIVKVWLHGSLGTESAVAAQVLLAWMLIDLGSYAQGTQWAVMQASNNLATVTWLAIILASLNLGASIYLISSTPLGVVGVVLPTLLQRLIMLFVLSPYSARLCGLTARKYFLASYLRPLIVCFVLSTAALCMRAYLRPSTLGGLALSALFVTTLWCLLSWSIALRSADRSACCHLFRTLRHPGAAIFGFGSAGA